MILYNYHVIHLFVFSTESTTDLSTEYATDYAIDLSTEYANSFVLRHARPELSSKSISFISTSPT